MLRRNKPGVEIVARKKNRSMIILRTKHKRREGKKYESRKKICDGVFIKDSDGVSEGC